MSLSAAVSDATHKWRRDAGLPLRARLTKAAQYVAGWVAAPLWLTGITARGHGTRVLGRPRIENHGSITLGDDVVLRSALLPLELYTSHGAHIVVGHGCVINSGVSLAATHSITLGNRVYLGTLVFVMDNNFHDVVDRNLHPVGRPVVLEDDVWIGVKATVLPGVRIGRGAVVGAHSLVTHDVAPYTLVAGCPARVVRTLERPPPPAGTP